MSASHLKSFLLALVAAATLGPGHAAAVHATPQGAPAFVSGQILVQFRADAPAADIEAFHRSSGTRVLRRYDRLRAEQLALPAGLSVEQAVATLGSHPAVAAISPNWRRYIDAIPSDPLFGDMWGLDNTGQTGGTPDADIDAPEAWDIHTGDASTTVAVIDSGAELTHPDLAANIWTNPGEIAGNGIDDDGNGYIDDIHGWDFSDNDNDPSPAGAACGGHGTHTAGTIGAVGNNGVGVTGVNWQTNLMILKAFDVFLGIFCSATDADLIAAIEYQTAMGVRVSSNSWGGGGFNPVLKNAIRASRSVFVAAAGNDGLDTDVNPQYPAAYALDNIVSVAATDHNDNLASFSNFGLTTVDLGAPGVNILSTLPGGYGAYNGTSMATPHVAGVATLMLAQDPTLTVNEIKWRLLASVDPTGLPVLTGGRLNAAGAPGQGLVTPDVTIALTPLGPTTVAPGDSVPYQAELTNHSAASVTTEARVYARLESGVEVVTAGPVTLTLAPGEVRSATLSATVPPGFPPGQDVDLIGQASGSTSFDEDVVTYTIVP